MHVCVCVCVQWALQSLAGEEGVLCREQDGADGGGMRPVLTVELRSSLGCLWVSPSPSSLALCSHLTVWAYASVSLWQKKHIYDVMSHLFPDLGCLLQPHRQPLLSNYILLLFVWVIIRHTDVEFVAVTSCFPEPPCLTCRHNLLLVFFSADRTGKRSTMPDSPADVKTQSRLTPPTMPPPPSTQGAPRNSSYTPTTREWRPSWSNTICRVATTVWRAINKHRRRRRALAKTSCFVLPKQLRR